MLRPSPDVTYVGAWDAASQDRLAGPPRRSAGAGADQYEAGEASGIVKDAADINDTKGARLLWQTSESPTTRL